MREPNDRDWMLVNAYHDGELAPAEARDLEARLATDPALAGALEQVAEVSGSLAALRPAPATPDSEAAHVRAVNRDNPSARRWAVGAALAAGLAAAAVLLPQGIARDTPIDLHRDLARRDFPSTEAARPAAMEGTAEVPDLGIARLAPVDVRSRENGTVAHYAGANGCRLTYLRMRPGMEVGEGATAAQVSAWITTDGWQHVVVATGMDQDRFDAIVAYVGKVTRDQSTEDVVASLAGATEGAASCLG